ncbi:hypothetical protein ASD64_19885 [Mesorhizobium sp. Root157]|uniref:DUF1403 family protein n=1 Tax=Mesorhizobium sp. Root157 TaxID=1736477 RepID=UPI0006F3D555|nr:DUF1403 family protein [Mesorhizobium sp. Root157]KQZ87946.1 hypothetical protein ASD64_19885 [Mesorhizobium sp. Root157]
MILRPKSFPRHYPTLPGAPSTVALAPVPAWLRRAVPDAKSLASKDIEDVALAAGAAIGALDQVVRREEKWAGVWRQRLALTAAAVTARQAGRVEDESALRDAVLLTRPGDFLSVGPAGSMLLAWRRLAARPAEELLTLKNLAVVLKEFGYGPDDEVVSDLADDLRQFAAGAGMVAMLTGPLMATDRYGFGRSVGAWFADTLLAQCLGWAYAVPLLGAEALLGISARPRRSVASSVATRIESDLERAKSLLAAQARAALRAIDLSAELGRRADRLLAVAPKLRAKGSALVVNRLLSNDALVASEEIAGISDRGLRRLFDRLVELGAVRELSGRATFRIYGL